MVDMNFVLLYLIRNFFFSFNVVVGEFLGVFRKLSFSVFEKVGECERLFLRLFNVFVIDILFFIIRRFFVLDGEFRRLVSLQDFFLLKFILIEILYFFFFLKVEFNLNQKVFSYGSFFEVVFLSFRGMFKVRFVCVFMLFSLS